MVFGAALPGDLAWLVLAAFLAGLVRGFAGFGTAMVFMPIAAQVAEPVQAVLMLMALDLIGPLPTVPRALRDGHLPDLARLGIGLVLGLPIGIFFLTRVPGDIFRLAVSVATLGVLILLIAGIRYRGPLSAGLTMASGGLSGVLGGATSLFGPPVLMIYMASTLPARVVRANLTLYLILTDAVFMAMLGLSGAIRLAPVVLGLALVAPYVTATLLGQAMFRPETERVYRLVAYTIIAAAAISGLPIFG